MRARILAFFIHLAGTLAVLGVVYLVAHRFWFPYPFMRADGGLQTFILVAGVALTLGPLLTLMVFRPGKKSLRMDLAVVGLLQVAGLAFGVHALYIRRTQMVVYSQGSFYGVDQLRIARIGAKGQALLKAAKKHPLYVYVHLPRSKKAVMEAEIRTLRGEPPIFLRGWRYRLYTAQEQKRVLARDFPLVLIARTNPVAARVLAQFRAHHPKLSRYTFVPLRGTYQTVILALRRSDGHVVGVLPFNPGLILRNIGPARSSRRVSQAPSKTMRRLNHKGR